MDKTAPDFQKTTDPHNDIMDASHPVLQEARAKRGGGFSMQAAR